MREHAVLPRRPVIVALSVALAAFSSSIVAGVDLGWFTGLLALWVVLWAGFYAIIAGLELARYGLRRARNIR